jgi:hypothetical protein
MDTIDFSAVANRNTKAELGNHTFASGSGSHLDFQSTAVIENFRGGGTTDYVHGNDANNRLVGNTGMTSFMDAAGGTSSQEATMMITSPGMRTTTS